MESKPEAVIQSKVIGFKSKVFETTISSKDAALYALGIGFNNDPLNTKHFKFTYELSDNFTVFPTFSAIVPLKDSFDLYGNCPGIPEFNAMNLLHGEEWLSNHAPLPLDTPLQYQMEFVDVEDKGKGVVFCLETRIFGKEDKKLYSVTHCNTFVRKMKGNGAKAVGPLKRNLSKAPQSNPDKVIKLATSPNQALYYRLGGNDPNPLHVDPEMSSLGGFPKPILHGLCFYGVTARAAYDQYCNDEVDNFLSFNTRFTSHVIPGETLVCNFWKKNEKLIVSVSTEERKQQVLIGEITLKNAKF